MSLRGTSLFLVAYAAGDGGRDDVGADLGEDGPVARLAVVDGQGPLRAVGLALGPKLDGVNVREVERHPIS